MTIILGDALRRPSRTNLKWGIPDTGVSGYLPRSLRDYLRGGNGSPLVVGYDAAGEVVRA